jgi:hypothetical protein
MLMAARVKTKANTCTGLIGKQHLALPSASYAKKLKQATQWRRPGCKNRIKLRRMVVRK